MTTLTRLVRLAGLVLLVAIVVAVPQPAAASRPTLRATVAAAGPTVQVDPAVAKAGGKVRVTVEGFDVPYVTVSVCGNAAQRGSTDCNMVASKGFELKKNGESTWTEFQIAPPPVPCPCVIRVSSTSNNSVATVPIELVGHDSAPVTGPGDPGQPLVEVVVESRRVQSGLMSSLRAQLGGASEYDVTVAVRNLTTDTLRKVTLSGAVGRSVRDIAVSFDLENPGELAPGEVATQHVRVKMPAPSVGTFTFSATAAGAGPIVTGSTETHPTPWLLIVLVCLFVLDLGVLIIRRLVSRRAQREATTEMADPQSVGAVPAAAMVIDVANDQDLIDA